LEKLRYYEGVKKPQAAGLPRKARGSFGEANEILVDGREVCAYDESAGA
jgi:hypothetical protein